MKNRGITLIALVVMIIVLLILAGVTIALVLNQGGIFSKAGQAKEQYSEQAAKERLELVLINLATDKVTKSEYNENEYIDDVIIKEKMEIAEDIVMVDGWSFQIDRSVPKIIASLGKSKKNENIKITATSAESADGLAATIQIQIQYAGELGEIVIAGESLTIPVPVSGVYTVTKQVNKNGTYGVVVKDKEGNYQTANIKIDTIVSDLDIWTKEDLLGFQQNVNKGRDYIGRTITLKADINLLSQEWVPIGNKEAKPFRGTFNGDYHKIENLTITSGDVVGLFGYLSGTVKNTIVQVEINGGTGVAAIAGKITNGRIENCGVSGNVTGYKLVGSMMGQGLGDVVIKSCYNLATISGTVNVGGISGGTGDSGGFFSCYNRGAIKGESTWIGGIAGSVGGNRKIENCYNAGEIQVLGFTYAGGIVGNTWNGSADCTISNCYNLGDIKATGNIGGILGWLQTGVANIENCYTKWSLNSGTIQYQKVECPKSSSLNTTTLSADTMPPILSVIGNEFKEDTNSINEGYPILQWQ